MEEIIRKDEDIKKITELFLEVLKKYNMDYVQFGLEIERSYMEYQKEKDKKETVSVKTGYSRDMTLKARNNTGEYNIELKFYL